MNRRPTSLRRLAVAPALAALSLAGVLALAACATTTPMPVPVPTPSRTPADEAITTGPELRPGQSAAANQQFFDAVGRDFYAKHGMGDGRSIIDAFVAAGFEKSAMELTPDTTALNIPADSIVFSVRIKGQCLIGQLNADGYTGTLAPLLATGRCLVGVTRPIDW